MGTVVRVLGTDILGVIVEYDRVENIYYVETYELGVITALPQDLERLP